MSKSRNPFDALLDQSNSKDLSKPERVARWAGRRYYSSVERREARASKAYDKKARKDPEGASLCIVCRKLELSIEDFNGLLKDDWSYGPLGSIRKAEKDARRVLKNIASQTNARSGDTLDSSHRFRRLGPLYDIKAKTECPFCRLVCQAAADGAVEGITEDAIGSVECSVGRLNEIPQYRRGETQPRRFVRRLLLTFTPSVIEPATLVLMADDAYEAAFLGRAVTSPMVDAAILTKWLRTCEGEHEHSSKAVDLGYTSHATSPHFRVIDVDEECIAQKSEPCRYLALSYVWGATSQGLKATKANIARLEELGGLRAFEKEIPRTIKDACSLVRALGERYLWVDRLCIVQDDNESKMEAIQHMDMIYAGSCLTIIAASNSSVHDGLPGFASTLRDAHQVIEYVSPGVRLMLSHGLDSHVRASVYQSRAWTYQERSLSSRCLIITEQRVFFQCQSRVWREDLVEENPGGPATLSDLYEQIFSEPFHDSKMQNMLDGDIRETFSQGFHREDAFIQYAFSVSDITGRRLTYHADALNAFSGIGKVMARKMKASLVEGLPDSRIDWAILWRPHRSTQRRSMFPSWSWAGWTSRADYHGVIANEAGAEGDRVLSMRRWILWRKLLPGKKIFDCLGPVATRENPWSRSQGTNPFDQDERRPLRWHFRPEALPSQTPTTPTEAFPQAPYTLLHFWTLSAFFELRILASEKGGLADRHGVHCGRIYLHHPRDDCEDGDLYEIIALSQSAENRSSPDGETSIDEPIITDRVRPIARDPSFSSVPPDAPEEGKYWGVSNSDEGHYGQYMTDRRQHLLLKYNVMVIEWHGEVAERIGIGEIDATAMNRSCAPGCSWKEIILG